MDANQREYMMYRLGQIESRAVRDECGHLLYKPRIKLHNGEFVASSKNKDGYQIVSYNIPGLATVSTILARAVYVLRNCGNVGIALPTNWHVSHLCHIRNCIASEHLSFEPGFVNRGRQSCSNEGKCFGGHAGYPECIFGEA
jgi:hypothetical protein